MPHLFGVGTRRINESDQAQHVPALGGIIVLRHSHTADATLTQCHHILLHSLAKSFVLFGFDDFPFSCSSTKAKYDMRSPLCNLKRC